MVKIRDYPCYNKVQTTINQEVKQDLNLVFPDAYKNAKSMAKISKYISGVNDLPYAVLPFCNTVEGEAFGGNVNYGDEVNGPRGAESIIKKIEEFLEISDIDFGTGRISEVLKAINMLKADGEEVILKISGPITILNILTDTKNIFKTMRRTPEIMEKVYEKIHMNLLQYIKLGVDLGADVISYGDSLVSMPILGEKMMIQYIDEFLVNFLRDVEKNIVVPVHICPKHTYGLIDAGRAEFITVELDPKLNYGQTFKVAINESIFMGERCINALKTPVTSGKIKVIKLKGEY